MVNMEKLFIGDGFLLVDIKNREFFEIAIAIDAIHTYYRYYRR